MEKIIEAKVIKIVLALRKEWIADMFNKLWKRGVAETENTHSVKITEQ